MNELISVLLTNPLGGTTFPKRTTLVFIFVAGVRIGRSAMALFILFPVQTDLPGGLVWNRGMIHETWGISCDASTTVCWHCKGPGLVD